MKTILKQAILKNTGIWTTVITWHTLGENSVIETKQIYNGKMKERSFTIEEVYTKTQFNEAYDEFHRKLSEWI